jgi:mannose-6-phosphate isomerase-like protein (cupin superfamily)
MRYEFYKYLTKNNMIKKFPFLEPQSKSPGVILYQADFKHFGNNRVPFAGGKFHLDVGSISKPDTHDFSECWMITQGSGILNYDKVDYPVTQGDFLFFEPQKTHFIHNNGIEQIIEKNVRNV